MTIPEILNAYRTIAVVGLSSSPWRPSFAVTEYMQSQGYKIIPVNPNESEVLGQKSHRKLEDVEVPIEIVNVFRRPQFVPEIAESAIAIGAKVLWLQASDTPTPSAGRVRPDSRSFRTGAC